MSNNTKWFLSILAVILAVIILVYVGIGLLPNRPFIFDWQLQWVALVAGVLLAFFVVIASFMQRHSKKKEKGTEELQVVRNSMHQNSDVKWE